jgi:hypothetical protein
MLFRIFVAVVLLLEAFEVRLTSFFQRLDGNRDERDKLVATHARVPVHLVLVLEISERFVGKLKPTGDKILLDTRLEP